MPQDTGLLPREGKYEAYDEIMGTISSLEEELDGELEKFEKKLKYYHDHSFVLELNVHLVGVN